MTIITNEEKSIIVDMFDMVIEEWGPSILTAEQEVLYIKLGGEELKSD